MIRPSQLYDRIISKYLKSNIEMLKGLLNLRPLLIDLQAN
jgi:hypothetical protein